MDQDLNEVARERRAVAVRVSRDFADEEDLSTLLGVAEHGLGALFDGECTIQLGVLSETSVAGEPEWLPSEGLRQEAAIGLSEPPVIDVVSQRSGVLLAPQSISGVCRAWVQFTSPRRVTVDEIIVGDLFAQAFAIAVDRLVGEDAAARREAHLRQAIDGHRIIGQATGIMMERHRLTPAAAFELLRVASQDRNVKLRDIAQRVIDTGEEPELA